MVRKGKYKPSHGGPTYLHRDNVRLKIILYLLANGKAIKNKMVSDEKSGLRGQEWSRFSNILDEMCDSAWIKKNPSVVEGVMEYELLEKGKEIALMTKKLQDENHPLLDLDAFYDVK